jgi:RNA polymerase sigma-B factor
MRHERALAGLMRDGDRGAREALVAMYLPLARALALRYRRGAEPVDDLVQTAVIGLLKAVDRWDPDRGVELRAYATTTVLGELRHHFRDHTWGLRPPRRLQDRFLAVQRAADALRSELGRPPTAADVARRLGCDEQTVLEAQMAGANRNLHSLDAPVNADDSDAVGVGELIPVTDDELERTEDRVTVERLIGILDDREREILRLRFEEDLRQVEIAARIGRSQMQVSRIIRGALDKLRSCAGGPLPEPGLLK